MAQNGITYVLNASNTCPKPEFISESHFMRIPVNDNYCEKLLPWLDKTNEFIGKVLPYYLTKVKYLGCLCLGFISPRARNLLSKTDLGSGLKKAHVFKECWELTGKMSSLP